MAKLYYDLIKLNLRTIDAVPITWRAATQALLDADAAAAAQEDNTTQNT